MAQVAIKVSIDDKATPALKKIVGAMSGVGLENANKLTQRSFLGWLKEYHTEYEARGGWENPALPTHGAGRKPSGFGENVVRAWQAGEVSQSGFTATNNATGLAHKATGGTITPKVAQALTIPMVPGAHGVRARDYPGRLFRPKGKDYLMEVTDTGPRVVYLLRKSVTQKPWPKALPSEEAIADFLLPVFARNILAEALDE